MGDAYPFDYRSEMSAADRRITNRRLVRINAVLRIHATVKIPVVVEDLSVTGFRCECAYDMAIGATAWLTLPRMAGLQAHVMRRNGWHYGFAFTGSLHPAIFEHIASSYRD